jgi:hypothetical protein
MEGDECERVAASFAVFDAEFAPLFGGKDWLGQGVLCSPVSLGR